MARYKHPSKKQRLIKKAGQTKWAPFWAVLKKYPKRRMHPSRITSSKRSWRRVKTKA
ncbi:50S ribosomal protein L39e [Candidatus Woesearchaeota archaeon]|nr:50S ribosomal protein L39e [Candidatus Woesearchaeota archaeon]